MLGILLRLVLAVAFGLATFWPEIGLMWQAQRLFPAYPIPVVIGTCLWAVVFSLLLPLSRGTFQVVSSGAILVACSAVFWWMHQQGRIDVQTQDFWLTWGVGVAFFLIGWLMISTRIWRATHGVVAVDDTDDE